NGSMGQLRYRRRRERQSSSTKETMMTNIDLPPKAERPLAERMGLGRDALTIDEVAARVGLGRDGIYRAIREHQLRARKFGKRTVILANDLQAFLQALPEVAA